MMRATHLIMDWVPDLRQLRAFVAVVEEGSFTLAARRIFVTQSAVSHSLRTLEEQLSCRLLDRTGKRVAVTAEGEAFPSARRRLQYVDTPAPPSGQSVTIAPGVRWGRIPLPLDLNHINVWLVETADGCVVVDTGMVASIGKDAWEVIEREYFSQRPLRAVFITHIHPDHIGLARWLQERLDVPVIMSRRTHELAYAMWSGEAQSHFNAAEQFFLSHGVTDALQIRSMFRPDRFVRKPRHSRTLSCDML